MEVCIAAEGEKGLVQAEQHSEGFDPTSSGLHCVRPKLIMACIFTDKRNANGPMLVNI